jgi:CelD/BcsL family acetyltransferase involved in cellulose biosynthesis
MLRDSEFQLPFYSWTWYDTWWRHFAGEYKLFLVAMEDARGRLLAAAPLMQGRRCGRGLWVSEITFMANCISPRNSLLFRRGVCGAEVLACVLDCLAAHHDAWDMTRLWNLPEEMPYLADAEDAIAAHGFYVARDPGWQSAYIALEHGFEPYMADNFSKQRRRGIRQKVRQLSALPGYRVREFRRPEEMPQALELAFAVSRASWKGRIGTDMSQSAASKGFYTELTERLAPRGEVRIWVSLLDDIPLALEYSLVSDKATYLIVNDFNAAYERLSPGTVLLHQVVERAFAEHRAEFQFSGDIYDYKSKWATGIHHHVTLDLFQPHPYSQCLWWLKTLALPAWRSVKTRLTGRTSQAPEDRVCDERHAIARD